MQPVLHRQKPRIKTLDSLRGLAALSVVVDHTTGFFPYKKIISYTPFSLIYASHQAVIFFFILSGYVLVYQYAHDEAYTYWRFLIQRIFRIYLPYLAAIACCYLLICVCWPVDNTGYLWISKIWLWKPNVKTLIDHLSLVGNFNTDAFNGVIWSLVHEMRVSLVFPLLLLIASLKYTRALPISVLISCAGAFAILLHISTGLGYYNGYSYTVYYFYMFVFGGLIAQNQQKLILFYNKIPVTQKAGLLSLALLLYCYSNLISQLLFNHLIHRSDYLKTSLAMAIGDAMVILGSVYIIIAAISMGNNSWLATKKLVFLGRISYSLYLLHVPVIAFFYYQLHNKLGTYTSILTGFILAWPVAVLFNRYIEQPSVRMAKKLLARYAKS